MTKKLLVFGDSWPAGAELLDGEKTFGEILSIKLGVDFVNYSQQSTSLEHMLLQLQKFIDSGNDYSKTKCLFFLTSKTRSIYYNGKKWLSLTSNDAHYVHLYSSELALLRSNMVVLCLQSICKQFGIDDYYIGGWEKFEVMLPGINLDKIYDQGNTHCLNFFKIYENDPTDDANFIFYDYNHFIKPKICHPNQLGHETIANKLYEWMNK